MADRATETLLPTPAELEAIFRIKHGDPDTVGWSPRRRFRAGYYLPADVYEAVVRKLITPGCHWLDVGGGHNIFPENAPLGRELAARAQRVVAVDPSENVLKNDFVHERVKSFLEEYHTEQQFDVATMRMVVEHVSQPESFVGSLARLVKPGGTVVVFTINRWAPVSLVSGAVPFGLHHAIKKRFWGGEEEDTFPVQYLMNTQHQLRRLFDKAGFRQQLFAKLDDLSVFGGFNWLGRMELLAWRCFRAFGLTYPENCLLGVYQRTDTPVPAPRTNTEAVAKT